MKNGKWQQSRHGVYCIMGEKWAVVMKVAVELDGPVVHLWQIVKKVVGEFTRVVGGGG